MITGNKLFLAMAAIIIVLVGAVAVLLKHIDVKNDDNKAFQIALLSKFDTLRNKIGQQTASVPTAVFGDIQALKESVAALNAQGANIQSKLDNNTQSLTLLSRNIGSEIHGTTKIGGYDTVKSKTVAGIVTKDTVLKVYPIYKIDTLNKFYSLSGQVGYKQFVLKPVFFDSLELKGELVKHGLFKAGELTEFALSKNPFASTTSFKSLVVKKTPAPVWKYVFIVVGAAGGFYLGEHIK